MRHIITILLENQAGALARVAGLISTRGYNIESLNVAPTDDDACSRLTLVTRGSDEVIHQIANQLGKLVDVVSIVDMTGLNHLERELALFKVHASEESQEKLAALLDEFGGHVLGYDEGHGTLELIGSGPEIDEFMKELGEIAEIDTVARSGAMAIAKGSPVLNPRVKN